jgi:hypothetical protein
VVARDDALRQLFQLGARQHVAQFGLADQDDLQQLALVRFKVGQQAQLFEHVGRQVLRLVDDEHIVIALRMAGQQVAVDRVDIGLDADRPRAHRRQVDAVFVAHRQQQLFHRQLGIEDVGEPAIGGNLLDEAAAHGGLAGPDFAGQQHEAAAAAHAVEQVRQRFPMAFAHEQIARVGGDRKRRLLEAEVMRVHVVIYRPEAPTGIGLYLAQKIFDLLAK